MDKTQRLDYEKLLNTMINDYGVKNVTNKRQASNGTLALETANGEKFQIYKSGYVRRTIKSRYSGEVVYQINPTMKSNDVYITFSYGKLKKIIEENTLRIKIYNDLARLTYLFNFLVKNKYIEKQTNKLNAEIKI